VSHQKVGTREFADAVVARLGQKPEKLKAKAYGAPGPASVPPPSPPRVRPKQETVGVDVYVGWNPDSDALAARLQPLAAPQFRLTMVTSRGIKVWPDGQPETFRGDQYRTRFMASNGGVVRHADIIALLSRITADGVDFIKIENLSNFDGERGYSLGQGE
jgi:isocitrate dehydrogenase